MIPLTQRIIGVQPVWEPIEPVCGVPQGGWPRALMRLELGLECPIAEAIYEVCRASRQFRRGVVMTINGMDLFAFPHQSCDEVARTWHRLNTPPVAPPKLAPAPVSQTVRWTPLRKVTLVSDIALGRTTFVEACKAHNLTAEELNSWIDGFQAHGLAGVMATKVQTLR